MLQEVLEHYVNIYSPVGTCCSEFALLIRSKLLTRLSGKATQLGLEQRSFPICPQHLDISGRLLLNMEVLFYCSYQLLLDYLLLACAIFSTSIRKKPLRKVQMAGMVN